MFRNIARIIYNAWLQGRSMAENKKLPIIAISVFFGAVGSFMAMLLTAFAVYIFIDLSFLSNASCADDQGFIYCFFDDQWDSETYLSALTGFYSTIITVLIGLMGVIAAFAFFAIRGSTLQQGEEVIEKEVDRYFKSEQSDVKLQKSIEAVGLNETENIKLRLEEIEIALVEAEILKDGKLEA